MTLLELIQYYLTEKKFLLELGTKKKYHNLIKKLKNAGLLEIQAEKLTKKHIEVYILYCLWVRHNKHKTINKELKSLNAVLNFARKRGKIKNNYVIELNLKERQALRRYLSEYQLKELYKFYERERMRRRPKVLRTYPKREALRMFLFSCLTGLRYSDIVNLSWDNVHFCGDENFLRIIVNKTGKVLSIPLPAKALELLQQSDSRSGKVFLRLTNQYINRVLKEIQEHNKIPVKMTMHTGRHTYATLLLNKGTPIGVVSELLGHNKIETTKIYAKLLPSTKLGSVSKLDEIF